MAIKVTFVYWVTDNGKRVKNSKSNYYGNMEEIEIKKDIENFYKKCKGLTHYIIKEETKNG